MFTLEQVRTTLAEVVAEKGEDFVFMDECAYVNPEDVNDEDTDFHPACIVGQVIAKLEPEWLKEIQKDEWTYEENQYIVGHWTKYSWSVMNIDGANQRFDGETIEYLAAAQNIQDSRYPYGEALKAAEGSIESVVV